jgi:hypothetical protein
VPGKVGSYGSQHGKIISVLDVLVANAHLPQSELTLKPLREFRQLSDQVKEAVATIQGPQQKSITQADVDQFIENLQSLANSNQKDYGRFVNQLKAAIAAVSMARISTGWT